MDQYERNEYNKFIALINAAEMNMATTGGQKVHLETSGHNPKVHISVEAYVLRKFIKEIK